VHPVSLADLAEVVEDFGIRALLTGDKISRRSRQLLAPGFGKPARGLAGTVIEFQFVQCIDCLAACADGGGDLSARSSSSDAIRSRRSIRAWEAKASAEISSGDVASEAR